MSPGEWQFKACRTLRIVALTLCCTLLLGLGGCLDVQVAPEAQSESDRADGGGDLLAAYEQGYTNGTADATQTRELAYEQGYDAGWNAANASYSEGWNDGYKHGFDEGVKNGSRSAPSSPNSESGDSESGGGGADVIHAAIEPLADTYVNSQYPENNYGTRTTMSVADFGNSQHVGVLKFDLDQLVTPSSSQTVCLALESQSYSPDYPHHITVRTYNDTEWQELGLTWTSFDESLMGDSMGTHQIQHLEVERWDVSAAVGNPAHSGLVSFVVSMEQQTPSTASSWWTREGNTAPLLEVKESCSG